MQVPKKPNTKKRIDYFSILEKAWQITWHNKYLWWFGLFMALGGGVFNFNFSFDGENVKNITGSGHNIQEKFNTFIVQYAGWIILTMVFLLVLIIIFMMLRIIGQAGIIKSTNNLEKNENASFRDGFKSGRKYFWRILLLGLILGGFIIGILFVLSIPVIYLFYLTAYPIAFLSLFLAIIIFIPIVILASFIRIYGSIYIVVGELKTISAIENAYKLFRKNILASMIISLVLAALSMAIGIGLLVTLLPIALVILPVGIVLYYLLNKIGIVLIAIVGVSLFILIVIFVRSIYETFGQVTWVLFFRNIAEDKRNIEKRIKNEVVEKKIAEAKVI